VDQEQGKTSEWAKARLNRVTKARANGRFKIRARGSEGRKALFHPRLALSWEAGARARGLPDHAGDDLVASAVFRGVQAMAVRGKTTKNRDFAAASRCPPETPGPPQRPPQRPWGSVQGKARRCCDVGEIWWSGEMTRNRDHAARARDARPTAATLGFRPRKAKELLPTEKSWSGEMTKNRDLRLPHAAHVDKVGWVRGDHKP
jgi:hypothetical protein